MIRFILAFLTGFGSFFRSRYDLALELVALRQQVGVLKRKKPRPQLSPWDRLFWLGLRRWWSQWASVLVIVKPEPSSAGIAPASAGTGASFRRIVPADRKSAPSFAISSDR